MISVDSKKEYVIVHGTNGEGYSNPTIKRVKTLPTALAYALGIFGGRSPELEHDVITKNGFSMYETDSEEDTERVSIFEILSEDVIVVSVEALTTEFDVHYCRTKKAAQAKLKELSKVIVELNEDSTKNLMSGEGEDGYHHFEIV